MARKETSCCHSGTDGTIACPDCGISAIEFITRAAEYLDRHPRAESYFSGYLIGNTNLPTNKRTLVQVDYDFPPTARDLGWSIERVQIRRGEVVHLARRPRALIWRPAAP